MFPIDYCMLYGSDSLGCIAGIYFNSCWSLDVASCWFWVGVGFGLSCLGVLVLACIACCLVVFRGMHHGICILCLVFTECSTYHKIKKKKEYKN